MSEQTPSFTPCGAKTKSGEPCQKPPVTGSKRCRLHGGLTPVGFANANTKHGRYSKALPKHLLSDYERFVSDPEALNLNEEIALATLRVLDQVERLSNKEEGVTWADVEAAIELRRKLCATQSTRLESMKLILTTERAYLLMMAIQDIIMRHVADEAERRAIAFEMRSYLDRNTSQQLPELTTEE